MAFVDGASKTKKQKRSKEKTKAEVKAKLKDQVKDVDEETLKKVPQSKQKAVAVAAARSGLKKSEELVKSDPSPEVSDASDVEEAVTTSSEEVTAEKEKPKEKKAFASPQPSEFTFGGKAAEKPVIKTQTALEAAVEQEIDNRFGGLDLLFKQNDFATSPNDWAKLVYSYMETAYVLGKLDQAAVLAAVQKVKTKWRVQMLDNLANNLVYATTNEEPESVEELKELLNKGDAFLEDQDDAVLEKIVNRTVGQDEDYSVGWTQEVAQITAYPKGREDLVKLIARCSGDLYSHEIGTIVGGWDTKGKKIDGLSDQSARIDRQNPPPNAFNIQYQVGNASCAGVIFDISDPREVVLEKLLESFDAVRQFRSPRVKAR
jgi:hypothetical protein